MNYQQYMARRLTENQLKAIRSYPQPIMFGGVHPMDHPLASGNEYSNPSTLVTGSGVSGGKMSKTSKALLKGLKTVGKTIAPVVKDIGSQVAKNVAIPALTKYGTQALESYLMPAAETAAETVAANPELLLLAAGRVSQKKRGRPRKVDGGALFGLTKKKLAAPIDKLSVEMHKGSGRGGNRRQARADAVKSIMRDSSMNMAQASKFIKDNNVEY